MFGIVLIFIGTFFDEISSSIGKYKANKHEESPYTMAFLSLFWSAIFFILISLIKNSTFIFKLDSLPTFSIRAILEIIQLYVSIFAVIKADRTTFSFVRTITIPLLLLVDFIIGYKIGTAPLIGITLIIVALLLAFSQNGIKKKGLKFVIFSAVNAVITTSLFKYNIIHYNSIVAEQLLITLILLICSVFFILIKEKENPFAFLAKPVFFLQSVTTGLAGVFESFAFNFSVPTILMAAKRSSAIFWSILSGKEYFKEKHTLFKFLIFSIMLLGLILLSFN